MRKLLDKTVTMEMLQAGQDAWLNDHAKRSSVLWQAMFEAAPDYTEKLVEAIAEEVALFNRGSRATLGWHIKRALMGEGMHVASSAGHLGNTPKTDEVGSIPTSPAHDDVAKAIADALPDIWRHEAFMDLVNLATKAALSTPAKQVGDAALAQILTNAYMQAAGSSPKCVKQLGKDMVPWVRNSINNLTTQPQPKLPSEDEVFTAMATYSGLKHDFGNETLITPQDAYRALIALMEGK